MLSTQQLRYFIVLTLETLQTYLVIDERLTEAVEEKITPHCINLFLKYNHDPEILRQLLCIIREFCIINSCKAKVQNKFVPTLVGILTSPKDRDVSSDVLVAAMDCLQWITKYSNTPLNEILVLIAFPTVIKTIMKTDDPHLMQVDYFICLHLLNYTNII